MKKGIFFLVVATLVELVILKGVRNTALCVENPNLVGLLVFLAAISLAALVTYKVLPKVFASEAQKPSGFDNVAKRDRFHGVIR